ncbi:MAG: DUF937 domain-containing protein [Firmicutes bacterium]|nr:DUF937 domain-containing protein [Bacillota bacterium]
MDLLSMLLSSMTSNSSVEALSKKSGGSSKGIKMMLLLAVPLIIKYLTKNAKASQSGATSLLGALQQHTSTQAVSNQIANADTADGAAILGHIFGNDYSNVVSSLASQSGLTQTQASSVLQNIAPALMSSLSAATTSATTQSQSSGFNLSDGLDLSDIAALMGGGQKPQQTSATSLLSSLMGGSSQQTQQSSGLTGMLGSLLGGGQQQQQSTSSSLLGSLLGGGSSANDNALNGMDLLSTLLSVGK